MASSSPRPGIAVEMAVVTVEGLAERPDPMGQVCCGRASHGEPSMSRSKQPIDQFELVAASAEAFTLEHFARPDQGATGPVQRPARAQEVASRTRVVEERH
jgi:hypothetical protein